MKRSSQVMPHHELVERQATVRVAIDARDCGNSPPVGLLSVQSAVAVHIQPSEQGSRLLQVRRGALHPSRGEQDEPQRSGEEPEAGKHGTPDKVARRVPGFIFAASDASH